MIQSGEVWGRKTDGKSSSLIGCCVIGSKGCSLATPASIAQKKSSLVPCNCPVVAYLDLGLGQGVGFYSGMGYKSGVGAN